MRQRSPTPCKPIITVSRTCNVIHCPKHWKFMQVSHHHHTTILQIDHCFPKIADKCLYYPTLYTSFISSSTTTYGKKSAKITDSPSRTKCDHTTAARFFMILSFKFVKMPTILRHTPRQAIQLKMRELQGCTDILLLVNEALVVIPLGIANIAGAITYVV